MKFKCYKCKILKLQKDFTKDKTRNRGFTYDCKECRNLRMRVGKRPPKVIVSTKKLWNLWIGNGWNQKQIGEYLGCSQSYAGKIIEKHGLLTKENLELRECAHRKKMDRGYVLVYRPQHYRSKRLGKRKGFVKEHILIAELEVIGRRLEGDERVHHINGVKIDNRPENLFVCGNREHKLIHCQLEKLALQMVVQGKIGFENGKYKEA